MGSLQDALLKTGLADERQKPDRKPDRKPGRKSGQKSNQKSGHKPDGKSARNLKGKGRGRSGNRPSSPAPDKGADSKGRAPRRGSKTPPSDLERAWIARRKAEKDEKERIKQARVADQEARRKRNLELDRIVEGKVLNDENGELPRYFEHLGRIRRVMCTPGQREAINAGELGIVNLRGRYLIVEPDVLAQYRKLAEDLVPDLSGAEPEGGEESDGGYPPVPDDLIW